MSRAPIFAAVKAARGGKSWSVEEVKLLDACLDQLGVAREAEPGRLEPSRTAFENIKTFESCELAAYPDPGTGGDPWTVGWGAVGPGIRKGVVWTQQQADERLKQDVAVFADGVRFLIGENATTQGEFDALVSLAYNIGLKALQTSTLLKKHNAGDKAGAANEFARWTRAGGKILRGLTRRREAEAKIYRGQA